MSYTNGKITGPVSIRDVQRAVPVILERTNTQTHQTERGVSCDLGVLCGASVGDTVTARDGKGNWTVVSRTEINKWAKYKPVRMSGVGVKSDSEFAYVRYGLDRTTTPPLFTNEGRLNHAPWRYYKPNGGISSPYRLSDFVRNDGAVGYYHNAPCPINLVFSHDTIPLSDYGPQGTISFTFTFERGINGDITWLNDGTCLFVKDIFYNNTSLERYLTVGLIHYVGTGWQGYFKSSEQIFKSYVVNEGVSPTYAASVIVFLDDFKTKMAGYISQNTKYQGVMFLSDNKYTGVKLESLTGNTELLQYDGDVEADSEGYENGCDRKIMTVTIESWAGRISYMKIEMKLTRQNTSSLRYNISYVKLTLRRESASDAIPELYLSFTVDCVEGTIGNTGIAHADFIPSSQTYKKVSFGEGQTEKVVEIPSSEFTNYYYLFNSLEQGRNNSRAVINAHFWRYDPATTWHGNMDRSIGLELDCRGGGSTIVDSKEYTGS